MCIHIDTCTHTLAYIHTHAHMYCTITAVENGQKWVQNKDRFPLIALHRLATDSHAMKSIPIQVFILPTAIYNITAIITATNSLYHSPINQNTTA